MWDIKFPNVLMFFSGFHFPLCKRGSLFLQNDGFLRSITECTYVLFVYHKASLIGTSKWWYVPSL